MNTRELAEDFPDGRKINQVMNGKKPMPSERSSADDLSSSDHQQQEKKERQQKLARITNPTALMAPVTHPSPVQALQRRARTASGIIPQSRSYELRFELGCSKRKLPQMQASQMQE